MAGIRVADDNAEMEHRDLQIIRYAPFQLSNDFSSPWFDLRVFYIRISNFQVDDSTSELLTLTHIPLCPETLLEVNGARSSTYNDGVSSLLRRDRVDKLSYEATFVSTDSMRTTGSVKFMVSDRDNPVLSGVLGISNANGVIGELKNNFRKWSMNCVSEMVPGIGFLKRKLSSSPELPLPSIEVFVAGSFSGSPVILTKTLQVNHRKKHNRKGMLESIPEHESEQSLESVLPQHDLQLSEFKGDPAEAGEDHGHGQWSLEYADGEDGELSWFNAGVRVGVGIGLGICLGIGLGVGLLMRSYHSTARTLKRRPF